MINVKQVNQMNILSFTNPYKIYSMITSQPFRLPDITKLKNPSNVSFYRSDDMAVDQYKIFYDDDGYPSHLLNMVVKKFKRSLFLLRIDYIHKLEKCPDDSIERCFNDIIMILENPSLPHFYSTGSPEPYSSCIKAFCSGVRNYVSELQNIFHVLRLMEEISENDWKLIKEKLFILETKYGVNSTDITSRYMDPALARCIRNSQYGLVSTKPVSDKVYFGKHILDSALEPIGTFDKIDEDVLVRSNPAMPICLRKTTAEDFIKIAGIKKVVYNYPATIVWWNDGGKTIVKVHKGEEFNKEMGLAMAIAKKVFGNTTGSRAAFKKVVNMADDHSMIDVHLYKKSNKTYGYLIENIKYSEAKKLADEWYNLDTSDHDYMFTYSDNKIENSSKARVVSFEQGVSLDKMRRIINGYRESSQIAAGESNKDISEED